MGAVGTNYVVSMLNSGFLITSRTGTTIATNTLAGFWNITNGDFLTDPRVTYDPFNNRFIASVATAYFTTNAAILLAVSTNADPTGGWYMWRVKTDPAGQLWVDQPKLGFNKKWIVAIGNMFDNSGNSINESKLWIFNKTNLYAGTYTAPTIITNYNSQHKTVDNEMPVFSYDNTTENLFFIQSAGGNLVSGLNLSFIDGAIGSEVYHASLFLNSPVTYLNNPARANFGPQFGSTNGIELGTAQIESAVYRDNYIWCAQTVFIYSPARSAVQWWEINGNGLVQRGLIDDPTGVTGGSSAVDRLTGLGFPTLTGR